MIGPEEKRLRERLSTARNFHVTWGVGVENLSTEERAAALNGMLDEVDRRHALPIHSQILEDMKVVQRRVENAFAAVPRRSLSDVVDGKDATINWEAISHIRHNLDFALIHLGNWLEKDGSPKARAALRRAKGEA